MTPPSADQEHLKLLAIFHYVVGGLASFFACFPLIHFGIGVAMIVSPSLFGGHAGQQPPAFIGWIFAVIGASFFLCGQALAICIIFSGLFIRRRVRYLYVFIVACVECLFMPFGTALGVFTIVVLSRESVKRLFDGDIPPAIPT